MVTIKQIAEKTGYSLSTVSIVLRGLSSQRNIPDTTKEIIMNTAKELGYHPNTSARRLRSDEPTKKSIAIFWATDFRATLVTKFLQGVQKFISDHAEDMEVIICPYKPNQLDKVATERNLSMYSGAIICTASQIDLAHIESISTNCPIVLYNRISDKFPSVGVDNSQVGSTAALEFINHHCTQAIVIADNADLTYAKTRIRGFVDTMNQANIDVSTITCLDNTIESGKKAAESLNITNEHTGLFISSDSLAFGVLSQLNKRNINIPDQVEIISVGTNEKSLYECFSPSLTVIEIPIEKMAYECSEILNNLIISKVFSNEKKTVPFKIIQGQSTIKAQ